MANRLHEAQPLRESGQEDPEEDEPDGVRKPEAPEHDRRQRGEEEDLDHPDDREGHVVMHRTESRRLAPSGGRVRNLARTTCGDGVRPMRSRQDQNW